MTQVNGSTNQNTFSSQDFIGNNPSGNPQFVAQDPSQNAGQTEFTQTETTNDTHETATTFFAHVNSTLNQFMSSVNDGISNAGQFVKLNYEKALNATAEYKGTATTTISDNYNAATAKANEYLTYVQDNANALKGRVADATNAGIKSVVESAPVKTVLEHEYTQAATKHVSDNAMSYGYATSAAGGYIAADASIRLLRNDPGTNKTREVAKLIIGSTMINSSYNYAGTSEMDKAALAICSLSAALVKAAWSATTNPVTHRIFVLKTFSA